MLQYRYFGWILVLVVVTTGVSFAEHMGIGKSGRPLGHVGPYTYISGQRLDALIRSGALDARLEIYAAPDGTKVQYQIVMLHNPDEATFNLQSEVSEQVKAGGKLMYKSALNDVNGQDIGEIALVLRSNGIESVYWTNLGLLLNAQGPPFHAARFAQNYLSYKVFSQPPHDSPPPDTSRPSAGGAGCASAREQTVPEVHERSVGNDRRHLQSGHDGDLPRISRSMSLTSHEGQQPPS